jgi:hypothetical protein
MMMTKAANIPEDVFAVVVATQEARAAGRLAEPNPRARWLV